MSKTNWLANLFNSLGEVFEKFNPAAFRFLAAFLPYLTPVPVAWVSQANATKFLNLPPEVSFIFVFGLEGIGLWFTALFVDSVVAAIRSKNIKAWITVFMFAVIVSVYVAILVNINVIIEQSSGQNDPAYSRVITMLCFLPLITGIGNGYYKLNLESKTNIEIAQQKQADWEQEQWKTKENNKQQVRLAKAGINPLAPVVQYHQETDMVSEKKHQASDYKDYVFELFAQYGDLPLSEITEKVNKAKRVQLVHNDVKGTWFKYKTQWKRSQA
jgi:hypothetical protein